MLMREMPEISIIVPAYNVETYIENCIDSILMQQNCIFEIICVNDGSTDNTLNTLEKYEKNHSCIKVFTKGNGGLSSARNYGLERANSKIVYFLDSDDMLNGKNDLEYIVRSFEEYDLDVLAFDGKAFAEDGLMIEPNYKSAYTSRYSYGFFESGKAYFEIRVKNWDYSANVGLYAFNREFLIDNELKFPEGLIYEDNLFSFQTMMKARRVLHNDRCIFLHRIRNGSIMRTALKLSNFISIYRIYTEVVRTWISLYPSNSLNSAIEMRVNDIAAFMLTVYNSLADDIRAEAYNYLSEYEKKRFSYATVRNIQLKNGLLQFPNYLFDKNEKVLIYGAGKNGKALYQQAIAEGFVQVLGMIDQNYKELAMSGLPVYPLDQIRNIEYDKILISIANEEVVKEVKRNLINCGVRQNDILWEPTLYFAQENIDIERQWYRLLNDNASTEGKNRFFLFMLPEHGNLGDYAIGYSEEVFLETYFPEYGIIKVTIDNWKYLKSRIISIVNENDVILISGGGNIGDIWSSFQMSKDIVDSFKDNTAFFLPNNLTYSTELISENKQIQQDIEWFKDKDKLHIFCREEKSWSFLSEYLPNVYLVPDMCLYMLANEKLRTEYVNYTDVKKDYVLTIFRNDVEKVFEGESEIASILKNMGETQVKVDTHQYKYIPYEAGKDTLKELFNTIMGAKLVITDRLHGMIFSVIANKPCIVFDNSTKKISGVYQWVKNIKNIKFVEEKYENIMFEMTLSQDDELNHNELLFEFDAMATIIQYCIECDNDTK